MRIGLILIVLFAIGCAAIYNSYDFAIQLDKYDFGDSKTTKTWLKDFLLSTGTSGSIAILLIISYNEVQNRRDRKNNAKICSIAAKRILNCYKNYIFPTYLNLGQDKIIEHLVVGDIAFIKLNLLNEQYFKKLPKIDLSKTLEDDPNVNWADFIQKNFIELNNEVDNVLSIYGSYLDKEIINSIEGIRNSKLIKDIKIEMEFAKNGKEVYFDRVLVEGYRNHVTNIAKLMANLYDCF